MIALQLNSTALNQLSVTLTRNTTGDSTSINLPLVPLCFAFMPKTGQRCTHTHTLIWKDSTLPLDATAVFLPLAFILLAQPRAKCVNYFTESIRKKNIHIKNRYIFCKHFKVIHIRLLKDYFKDWKYVYKTFSE